MKISCDSMATPAKRPFRLWPWSKRIIERGTDSFHKLDFTDRIIPGCDFERSWVVYEITNHWTGSVTLQKDYLD